MRSMNASAPGSVSGSRVCVKKYSVMPSFQLSHFTPVSSSFERRVTVPIDPTGTLAMPCLARFTLCPTLNVAIEFSV